MTTSTARTRILFSAGIAALLALASGPPAASAAVPAPLRALALVEEPAEDVATGDAAGASAPAAARRAVAAWPAARASALHIGVAPAQLVPADRAIARLSDDLAARAPLRRDANAVTGALAGLFGQSGDPIPADVHRLDYLDRSIALDLAAGSWTAADADLADIERTWSALAPKTMNRPGGRAVARRFAADERVLSGAVGARARAPAIAGAGKIGDRVDDLERVFAKP